MLLRVPPPRDFLTRGDVPSPVGCRCATQNGERWRMERPRRELIFRVVLGLCLGVSLAAPAHAQSDFKVCESTYALCTTAPCETDGAAGELACACKVETGFSVGAEAVASDLP